MQENKQILADEISLRRMQEEDVEAVAAMEEALFSDAWSRNSLKNMTDSRCDFGYVCVGPNGILAYCLVRQVLDEGEILRIATSKNCQRRGFAEQLLRGLMTELSPVTIWNLEVRESNYPAIHLYEKLGFSPIGVRKNYYREPTENALLMQLQRMR